VYARRVQGKVLDFGHRGWLYEDSFLFAISNLDAVADLLTSGFYEDAIEAGVLAGRGMVVAKAIGPLSRDNFDGLGIDLIAEFRKLPTNTREQGEYFSLITVLIPAAMWIVRLSLSDQKAAVSAGWRVAAACRQLANEEWADQELWRTAAELFELSSLEQTNAEQVLARAREIESKDERTKALRTLGYLLATWHASLDQAIHCQLACVEVVLHWLSEREMIHRLIFLPYIESYWLRAAREARFAFRSPDWTAAAIEAVANEPEAKRARAILCAAASGFRIRGLLDVVRTLREGLAPKSSDDRTS
jgi:hypothetical protein